VYSDKALTSNPVIALLLNYTLAPLLQVFARPLPVRPSCCQLEYAIVAQACVSVSGLSDHLAAHAKTSQQQIAQTPREEPRRTPPAETRARLEPGACACGFGGPWHGSNTELRDS